MFVDSHCHINFPELAARLPEIMCSMAQNQITHALCACVNLPDFPKVLAIAEQYPNVYASVGVHPTTKRRSNPTSRRWSKHDHPQGGCDRRSRTGLLPASRRSGLAAATLPHPDPCGQGMWQAADHPCTQGAGRHFAHHARGRRRHRQGPGGGCTVLPIRWKWRKRQWTWVFIFPFQGL